jgi:S-methylmethionine-dependent homocysteine/selenocysteine methylase
MRWRRVALIAGILVVAGGIGATMWGLLAYNEVTKVDRSDPEVVTDEFLRATLVRKDKAGADLYACENQADLASIKNLRSDLDRRETTESVSIAVTWGAYVRNGDAISADLTITARKGVTVDSREEQTWTFLVENHDGWRVCGATRVAIVPSATPTTAR